MVELTGIQNLLQGTTQTISGNTPAGLNNFLDALAFWGGLGLFIILLAGIFFYVLIKGSYNIDVNVRIKGAGGLYDIKRTTARKLIDEQGKLKLELWGMRVGKYRLTCPIPDQDYRMKNGRRDYYDLMLDQNQQLHPIKTSMRDVLKSIVSREKRSELAEIHQKRKRIIEESLRPVRYVQPEAESMMHLQARPEERQSWLLLERKRLFEKFRKPSLLEKWLPALVGISIAIVCVIIMFFLTRNIGEACGTKLAPALEKVANAITTIGLTG